LACEARSVEYNLLFSGKQGKFGLQFPQYETRSTLGLAGVGERLLSSRFEELYSKVV
jgi:hypothetical protein